MFELDENYVEARFFMLMTALGSPCVPSLVQPGVQIPFATGEDLDNWDHDEKLVKDLLIGKDIEEAVDLLKGIKERFRTKILREATIEDISAYFG